MYTFLSSGKEEKMFEDLTGRKFGRLTVLEFHGKDKERRIQWKCMCECGNEIVTTGKRLRNGTTKSCGCLHKEKFNNKTHGKRHTRIYSIWRNMLNRCDCKSHTEYSRYGGRGIQVCDEWKDFNNFYNWAITHGYTEKLSIDRENVNGNYEPCNCRWATAREQSRNTRRNRILEYNGKKQCIADWEEETGIHRALIQQRIDRLGWSVEKALSTPVRKGKSHE